MDSLKLQQKFVAYKAASLADTFWDVFISKSQPAVPVTTLLHGCKITRDFLQHYNPEVNLKLG